MPFFFSALGPDLDIPVHLQGNRIHAIGSSEIVRAVAPPGATLMSFDIFRPEERQDVA
jgi:hypothetical protein